ncbi:MAG TPA: hypothetical protein VF970_06525 [Gemmatimonadales bacterium]
MSGPEVLVPMSFFVSLATVLVLRGPLGKALAERISGRASSDDAAKETAEFRVEVEDVYHRLEDVEQRLDFAERLLTAQREREALPGRGE